MSEPDAAEAQPWIGDTVRLGREEIARFLATLAGFLRRPGRFSADWLVGRQRALNPLGFVATALAVSSFVGLLTPPAPDQAQQGALSTELAQAILPYVYYAAVGIVSHPLLRLFGSRRRLSASIAVALFAGGSAGLVATLGAELAYSLRTLMFGYSPTLLRHLPPWVALGLSVVMGAPLIGFFMTLMLAMAGLHQLPRWRAVVAVTLSLVILAVALGGLHRIVRFGIGVPHVTIWRHGRGIAPDVWF